MTHNQLSHTGRSGQYLLILESKEGREGVGEEGETDRERETSISCFAYAPPSPRDQTDNPGTCPEGGPNQLTRADLKTS